MDNIKSPKTFVLSLLAVLLTTLFTCGIYAGNDLSASRSTTHDIYVAVPAPNDIAIDGKGGDWAGVEAFSGVAFPIEDGSMTVFEEWDGGTWSGPDDHTTSFMIVWSPDAIYLGVVVTDEDHQNATANGWNGDALQIGIVPSGVRAAGEVFTEINVALGDDGTVETGGLAEDQIAIARDGTTTTYEVKFLPSQFGAAEFAEGIEIGASLCVNDGDGPDQLGQKGWSGWYPHANVIGKNAENAGLVKLVPASTAVDVKGKLTTTWASIKK